MQIRNTKRGAWRLSTAVPAGAAGYRLWIGRSALRVSLANQPNEAYEDLGRGVRTIARGYEVA
jgi:hypothetical protein